MPAQSSERPSYNYSHRKERRRWEIILEQQGMVLCWRCHRPILNGMEWDLGHDDHDPTIWRGPEHRRECNRSAGGRKGRANDRARRHGTAAQRWTSRAW